MDIIRQTTSWFYFLNTSTQEDFRGEELSYTFRMWYYGLIK